MARSSGLISGDTVMVATKSAWLSKINWTQAIALVAMAGTFFGFELDATTQAQILAGIIGIQAGVTWAFKTFFTSTVTPSSVPPNIMTE